MRKTASVAFTLLAIGATPLHAQARAPHLDLPLLDAPYNTSHGGRAPSMAQSLEVAVGFYELSHTTIQRAWASRRTLAGLTIALFDVFAGTLPLAAAWLQPEDQLFRSRGGEAGGLAALSVRYPIVRRVRVFAEVEGKTAGWVAGNVSLGANVATRVGASVRLQ